MTTILVVDDEFLVADVLTFALEDAGYMVVTAANGQKGLDAVERDRPDVVITDFMMPVMNGLEFVRALRQRSGQENLPVILMSGAQTAIAREHGHLFSAVLDKPFVVHEVVTLVRRLVGERR